MSAEDLGKRLIAEVEEGSLTEVRQRDFDIRFYLPVKKDVLFIIKGILIQQTAIIITSSPMPVNSSIHPRSTAFRPPPRPLQQRENLLPLHRPTQCNQTAPIHRTHKPRLRRRQIPIPIPPDRHLRLATNSLVRRPRRPEQHHSTLRHRLPLLRTSSSHGSPQPHLDLREQCKSHTTTHLRSNLQTSPGRSPRRPRLHATIPDLADRNSQQPISLPLHSAHGPKREESRFSSPRLRICILLGRASRHRRRCCCCCCYHSNILFRCH